MKRHNLHHEPMPGSTLPLDLELLSTDGPWSISAPLSCVWWNPPIKLSNRRFLICEALVRSTVLRELPYGAVRLEQGVLSGPYAD